MKLKFKKLDKNAVLPNYATDGSAGLDLTATSMKYDDKLQRFIYGTGLAVEIPKGYVGLLFPRSSVRKYSLSLSNCVGVIDSDYRGEMMATFNTTQTGTGKIYDVGDKCVQLIIIAAPKFEVEEVEELTNTERGTKGHGEADNGK